MTNSDRIEKLYGNLDDLQQCIDEYKARNSHSITNDKESALLLALKALLDGRSTPTWLKSASHMRMVYVNPAFIETFDVKPEEYQNLFGSDLWSELYTNIHYENDMEVLLSGEEMEFEELVIINGQEVLYKVRKWLVVMDGAVLGIAGETLGPVNYERD